MSYGKHQSFYFRKSWASKGIRAVQSDNTTLLNADSYLSLGIGKNMQQSLRFWLEAFQIIRINGKIHEFTRFGKLVSNFDPGFNTTLTKTLLQFTVASGLPIDEKFSDSCDSIRWFFNKFKDNIFTKEECFYKLKQHANNISENTLNRDIVCLLNGYTRKTPNSPEDRNISPLADLGLVTKSTVDSGIYYKTKVDNEFLSYDAIYFIMHLLSSNDVLTIDQLAEQEGNIGKTFNMSRLQIIEMVEKMIKEKFSLILTRTSGIDTIKLTEKVEDPYIFLEKAYKGVKL
ncbi:MAG: DUF4007 family protein [Acholeplasmatales bacterium]